MKTIKQQEEIAFNAITFKDAVTMLPLMNGLVRCINQNRMADFYSNLTNEEKEQYNREWSENSVKLSEKDILKIFKLLIELGFEPSDDLEIPTFEKLTKKK